MKASLLFSSSDGPQTLVTDWRSGNGDELSSFALTMGMKDSWPTRCPNGVKRKAQRGGGMVTKKKKKFLKMVVHDK